jgi:Flp pilus assembly CpaE family ATPase
MFQAFMLVRNQLAATTLEQLATESRLVSFSRILERTPSSYELARQVNSLSPDILFIELTHWESASSMIRSLKKHGARVTVIGVADDRFENKLEQCHEAGIDALLLDPTLDEFRRAVDEAFHRVNDEIYPNLVAFVPAKSGSGATTIALNTTGYLASLLSKEMLYVEGDLRAGVSSFLMGLNARQSVQDALENSTTLGYAQLRNYVVRIPGESGPGDVDLLLAKRSRRQFEPVWPSYYQLLSAARHRYESIVADLPEQLCEATAEIARRARTVYLVCANELPSLSLAMERIEDLKDFGVSADRIEVILNRWHADGMGLSEIEQALHRPVHMMFGEDFHAVYEANISGKFVRQETDLGRSLMHFAKRLAGVDDEDVTPRPRLGLAGWLTAGVRARSSVS